MDGTTVCLPSASIMQPTHLEVDAAGRLAITWNDGSVRCYDISELRARCPCATCNKQRSAQGLADSDPLPADPQAALVGMSPVGNYAYNIRFADGHSSGLFTLERLLDWGKPTGA